MKLTEIKIEEIIKNVRKYYKEETQFLLDDGIRYSIAFINIDCGPYIYLSFNNDIEGVCDEELKLSNKRLKDVKFYLIEDDDK